MSGVLPSNQPSQFDPNFQQPELSQLPPMPIADAANFVQAINAIRQVVQQLGSPKTLPKGNNNGTTRSGNNKQPQKSRPQPKNKDQDKKAPVKEARFTETQRKTSKQRVYNTEDNTQWVEFDQIDFLEFTDKVTGATIVWVR